jgi:hypothetical protein
MVTEAGFGGAAMRCVSGVVAASALAMACMFGHDCAAADAAAAKEHFDRFLLSSGFDLWRNGGSAHGGILWSPDGLSREGLTFKLLLAGGQYGYESAGTDVTGRYALASVMAGYRLKHGRSEITVFAGPDLQSHRLTPDDLGNRLRGGNAGLRVGADLWYQPSDTFMAVGSISLSTIGPNYWARAGVGWYLFNLAWIGPELGALGGDRYHQFRVGIHATSFRTGAFEWSAGFGFARDSDDHNGAYLRIGVLTRR